MAKIQLWEGGIDIRLVAETRYSASRTLHWHRHPFYEIGLVLSGECFWRIGSRERHRLQAGEAILLPPETLHSEEVSAGGEARLAWIGFGSAVPPPAWAGCPVVLGDDAAEVIQAFLAVYREHSRPGNGPRIRLAIQTILLLISRQALARAGEAVPTSAPALADADPGLNPRQLRSVEAAAHTLRENLNSRLTIAQIAAYHSLSAAHFSTLFHRRYGTTPRAFLRRARVEKAEELLALSDLSVKEIAAITGFVDSPHLCKAFRALRGVTPRAVRTAPSRGPASSRSGLPKST